MKIGNKNIILKNYGSTSSIWIIIPTISFSRDIFYKRKIEINYFIEFQFINLVYLLKIKIQKPYDTQDF